MKKRYILFAYIFLLSISSFSQIERIDIGNWYLHNLTINSETILNPLDSRNNNVTTEFILDSNGNYTFVSWICDSCTGYLNYNSESTSFTINNIGCTLGGCDEYFDGINMESQIAVWNIDNKLSNFFATDGVFNYDIEQESTDSPKTLTIIASNGNIAIYHSTLLSSSKHKFKSSLKIYPNPAQDLLFLSSESGLDNFNIEIFNVLGKLKVSKEDTKYVNIKNLSKGVYFLLVKDESGKTATKKIIKI